jgi:hypothetical protein
LIFDVEGRNDITLVGVYVEKQLDRLVGVVLRPAEVIRAASQATVGQRRPLRGKHRVLLLGEFAVLQADL